jgi:hypothetical protein
MTRTWLAWALLAVQTVLMAAFLVFSERARLDIERYGLAADISVAATVLAFPAVGVFILSRRPGHRVGWLFCFANLGWSVVNAAGAYARDALVGHPGTLPAADVAVWLYGWPGPLSVAAIVLLLFVFPDGRFLSTRWRALGRVTLVLAGVGSLAAAFAPGPIGDTIGFPVDNPFAIHGAAGDALRLAAALGFVLTLTLLIVSVLALRWRYRVGGEIQRLQIKWFAYAAATSATFVAAQLAAAGYFGSFSAVPVWARGLNVIAVSSGILLPIAAAIAILRYRLYDIDLLIKRTAVYGATSATIAGTFFLGIVALQAVLSPLTSGSELAIAASTLVSFALFQPIRSRVQDTVDRRFDRSRYDASRTLDAFADQLRDEVDLDTLRTDLIGAVRETMAPAHASLWLRERAR